MSLQFPNRETRNSLLLDYLLRNLNYNSIQRYIEITGERSIKQALKNNETRLYLMISKYCESMSLRGNVHVGEMHASDELYATMQFTNIKQQPYQINFDILIHLAFPVSTRVDCLQVFCLQPNNQFLLDSIRFDLQFVRSQTVRKNCFNVQLTQQPTLCWSENYALTERETQSICVYGFSAGNAAINLNCARQHTCFLPFETKSLACYEYEGNFLLGIALHCARMLKR